MIKIGTVCSGIGSPEQAIKELGISHEVSFFCEIDKYAKLTYEANHEAKMFVPDMTKCDWVGEQYYSDLFIGGIPCQAFSLAGKRLGELDPRGLLFFDFYRYVKNQQPKYFIIENVKGLLSDNGGKTFENWIQLLARSVNNQEIMFAHEDSLEYNIHYTVLNSKNFGVPQNRERVFIVGIRQDLPNTFRFPIGWKLDKRLKDVLESSVDEKYYLSDKLLSWISSHREKRGSSGKHIFNGSEDAIGCVTARYHKTGAEDNYISEPTCAAMRGRNPSNPSDRTTGAELEQTLEINKQGTTNTITSVAKDNLIIEASCLTQKRTEYGKAVRKKYEAKELSVCRAEIQEFGPRMDGITNTLSTVQKDKLIIVKEAMELMYKNTKIIDGKRHLIAPVQLGKSKQFAETSKLVGQENQEAFTIRATESNGVLVQNKIRRLTPLECFRLQAFPDDFFYKAKAVNSDTQLYKQAGNTITVSVIKAIINNLLNTQQ